MTYWIGIFFAIFSGILSNFASVIQKKIIKEIPKDEKIMKILVKKPLWWISIIIGIVIGTIFLFIAQLFIGPILIPGLLAFGLIILTIGSIKINGEKLKKEEIIGIITMIVGIFFIGFSELFINVSSTDILDIGFITRISIFTGLLLIIGVLCELFQRKIIKFKGILLITTSGLLFSINILWMSILMTVISHFYSGIDVKGEMIYFIIAVVMIPLITLVSLIKSQQAFKYGQASYLIPIQQVPFQIIPIFIYFLVFLLIPKNYLSIVYMIIGISLILISSILLVKRQTQMQQENLSEI